MSKTNSQPILSVHTIARRTRSEGPGERFAIWVQGCSIRCPGCCNPEMVPPKGAKDYRVEKLFDTIVQADIEGISLLGGEPFDQAHGCAALARMVREADMGVMVFTGYTLEQLRTRNEHRRLLKNVDLLKTGPYVERMRSTRYRWMGSTNQRLHFLTSRYRDHPDTAGHHAQSVTIDFSSGDLIASGWPDFFAAPGAPSESEAR